MSPRPVPPKVIATRSFDPVRAGTWSVAVVVVICMAALLVHAAARWWPALVGCLS